MNSLFTLCVYNQNLYDELQTINNCLGVRMVKPKSSSSESTTFVRSSIYVCTGIHARSTSLGREKTKIMGNKFCKYLTWYTANTTLLPDPDGPKLIRLIWNAPRTWYLGRLTIKILHVDWLALWFCHGNINKFETIFN